MLQEHYLDNSATTKVLEETAQKAVSFMSEHYGNPSSLHTAGFEAKCALDEAREIIARSMAVEAEEIYFTSGGTEGNNLAIFGTVEARKRMGKRIVTTAIEHPSVLFAMKELQRLGYEVKYLQPNREGKISTEQLEATIDEDTILVSMMLVNNETGVILPVEEAAKIIRRKKAPAILHTDAVQGYMKMPISPRKLGADIITVSGHKVHAPKGVGALYLSKAKRLVPRLFGGGQERGLRSGTESMPLIAAFGKAIEIAPTIAEVQQTAKRLNDQLRSELAHFPEVVLHSSEDALANVVNFSAGKVRAETMLHFLAQKKIYVSSGSACGKAKGSHVLTAMGVTSGQVDSALRVSFSSLNTSQDVEALISTLREGLDTLAH